MLNRWDILIVIVGALVGWYSPKLWRWIAVKRLTARGVFVCPHCGYVFLLKHYAGTTKFYEGALYDCFGCRKTVRCNVSVYASNS